MIITVTMNPAIDKTAKTGAIKPGGLNRLDDVITDAGGKGINVSKMIKALGMESVATGFLGGGAGREIKSLLRRQNIKNDFIAINQTTRTNLKVLSEDYGITEFNEPGAKVTAGEMAALHDKLMIYAAPGVIFVFSGSLPRGAAVDTYYRLACDVKDMGASVFIDADGEAFSAALEAKPDYIKPNKFELMQYFGIKDDPSPEKCAELCGRLIEKGVRTAAISMGRHGALFATRDTTLYAPGLPVRALSTVGAGDCMVGALACAFEKRLRLRDAAVLAMAASAGAVTTQGTKPPTKSLVDELKPLVKLIKIESK